MTAAVRILLADDHVMIRKGVRSVLESREGWQVCGEAADGREAVSLATRLRPDVVVMDLTMPELNGLDATRQIRRELPNTEVLILTMHESEQLMREVLNAGARGYVLKSDAGHTILDAVDSLRRHQPFFTSKLSGMLLESYLQPSGSGGHRDASSDALTPREREIVQLIAEGRRTKEAAALLGISEKTAETHRANLMRKLNLHSTSEVVRYALRNRMVNP